MSFFRSFLASLLAIMVSFFIIFFFFVALIAGLASQGAGETEPYVRDNSVLKISIKGAIPERGNDDPFELMFNPTAGSGSSMTGIVENLEKAAADKKIKGVWLDLGLVSASWPHLDEIHSALETFKKSGKFVYASTDDLGMNEQAYYLATASDSLFIPPQTIFEFDGFYLQPYFLKSMFDKLGIDVEVVRSGPHKSFADTYTRNDLSPENRKQYEAILNSSTNEFMEAVGGFTKMNRAQLDAMLNNQPMIGAEAAFNNKLVHGLMYPDQFEAKLKARLEVKEKDKLNTISSNRYAKISRESVGLEAGDSDAKIAVINAAGDIMPGLVPGFEDQAGMITVSSFKKSLDKVVEDEDVKAIVIRIDSPGGSASTSDMLHHLIKNAAKKKPVVASMGNVAASGGYYMAMGADTVVASPFTITGSIGVISVKYNVNELMTKKLGITFDEVKSHQNADWFSLTKSFTPLQNKSMEASNAATYEAFLKVVSENRGMSRDQVNAVAEGRVWTGRDAKEKGLVDVLGGHKDAIAIAAKMAGVEKYGVTVYPKPTPFFERFAAGSTEIARTILQPSDFELETLARRLLHLGGSGKGYPSLRMPVEFTLQ